MRSHISTDVMPREGGASSIPEAANVNERFRLWNTGSSGQAGRRHRVAVWHV